MATDTAQQRLQIIREKIRRRMEVSEDEDRIYREAVNRGIVQPIEAAPEQKATGKGIRPIPFPDTDAIRRQAGLAARTVAKGNLPMALGTALSEGIVNGINLALDKMGVDARMPSTVQAVDQLLTDIGLPKPETGIEHAADITGQFITGGSTSVAAGQRLAQFGDDVVKGVGKVLADRPGLQTASAATGGATSAVADAMGAGPIANFIATIGGSLMPGIGHQIGTRSTRNVIRGKDAGPRQEQMQQNIADFEQSGAGTGSLGQASGNRNVQTAEAFSAQSPGGAGVMFDRSTGMAAGVSQRVQQIADEIAPGASPTRAGRAISEGVVGKGGFIERFTARANQLYDRINQRVNRKGETVQRFDPQRTKVLLTKTLQFLGEKTAVSADLPETSLLLTSPFLQKLGISLQTDLISATGRSIRGITYQGLRDFRSLVATKMENPLLLDDVSSKQLKALYGAISEDIRLAARQIDQQSGGKPGVLGPAERAANRADKFWKAGRARIDELESVISKQGGMDKVFKAVMTGSEEGATIASTVMKSLDKAQKNMVSAAFIQRLGRALPGHQTKAGDVFSFETFMTNWDKTRNAHSAMFGHLGKKYLDDMDALGNVAENIKFGNRVFANPSQSAPTAARIGAGTALVLGTASGAFGFAPGFAFAAGALAQIGTSNAMARLLTKPEFVRWAAQSSKLPQGMNSQMINTLSQIANRQSDRDMALFAAALTEFRTTQTDLP